MKNYLDLLQTVTDTGTKTIDRTGVGTKSLFGARLQFDLADGFPLLTTKKMPLKTITTELLWFLQGRTDKAWLHRHGCHIWDEWGDSHIGPGYGWQWRCWGAPYQPGYYPGWEPSRKGTDQLANMLNSLKTSPESRRHLVTAWNPDDLNDMALPPCHTLFQFNVTQGRLNCQLYQRSADLFLGVPFNIASYSLLTHLVARETGLAPGTFTWVGGDTHIYLNHAEAVKQQLSRHPFPLPRLVVEQPEDRSTTAILPPYQPGHVRVENYQHHPKIAAPVAV